LKKELSVQDDNEATIQEIMSSKDSEKIKIRIGDKKFLVARSNLEKIDSMIKIMISGKYGNVMDEDGHYIIDYEDRSNLFPYILSYIRSGGTLTIPLGLFYDILGDAIDISRFFCLPTLSKEFSDFGSFCDPGEYVNVFAATQSGGQAKVCYYGCADGSSTYNANTFTGSEDSSYYNNGCLIDQGANRGIDPDHFRSRSYRSNASTGVCWVGNSNANSKGILVFDIAGKEAPRRINVLQVYQMNSDGRVTHIKFSSHMSSSSIFPAVGDAGWKKMHEEEWLEIPNAVAAEAHASYYSVIDVSLTKVIEPVFSRYIKIECSNDGRHGNSYYIQVRQIKAFSRLPGDNAQSFD